MNRESIVAPDKLSAVLGRHVKLANAMTSEIDRLRAENQSLHEKVAAYERRDRVMKIATAMEDKGLNDSLTFEEKVASINSSPDLDRIEEAVKLASVGNIGLPSVSETDTGRTADSRDMFHAYCVGAD